MDSSPSPSSPLTPQCSQETEELCKDVLEAEGQRETAYVTSVVSLLKGSSFLKNNALVLFLIKLCETYESLDKRVFIARALKGAVGEKDLNNADICVEILKGLKEAVFNEKSALYQALNHQKYGVFGVTFFGSRYFVAYDCAESLQKAQLLVKVEQSSALHVNPVFEL